MSNNNSQTQNSQDSQASSTPVGRFIIAGAPVKFNLKYRKANGQIKDYKISPLQVFSDSIVAYSFNIPNSDSRCGIKKFRNDRILDLKAE